MGEGGEGKSVEGETALAEVQKGSRNSAGGLLSLAPSSWPSQLQPYHHGLW